MKNFINNLQQQNRYSIALSILRLFICIHLLKKIAFEWSNMELIYGKSSIIAHLPFHFGNISMDALIFREHLPILLTSYILVIILFFFGIGKVFINILLLLFLSFFQRLNWLVLNGGDNLLFFLLFYLLFTDSYKHFSIRPWKFKHKNAEQISNLMSNLGAYSIMFQFCMIYFVSALHKIHADVWFNGVASYYTLLLERFKGTSINTALARNEYFVTISTYFTILFEMYFPVLIFVKKLKPFLVIMGIGLHLGIYIFMMIYDFQFVFIITYIIFFTNEELIAYKSHFFVLLQKFNLKLSIERLMLRNKK